MPATRTNISALAPAPISKQSSSPRSTRRRSFGKRGWLREPVTFSGVTDCYQPIEATYQLTRGCLDVCRRFHNPVSIITRGRLVLRDVDLLAEIHADVGATVYFSIPFTSDSDARAIEPFAPPPSKRFETLAAVRAAGIPVGVMVAPIIPGLNDMQIADVLKRAAEAGATHAGYQPLRLAASVAPVFLERIAEAMPERAPRIVSLIRQMRSGRINDSRFGHRMQGDGAHWESVRSLFEISCQRYGIEARRSRQSSTPKRRSRRQTQSPVKLRIERPARRQDAAQGLLNFGDAGT